MLAGVVVAGVRVFTTEHRPTTAVDLLAAALGVVVLVLLTRGLHLDGLADTFFDGFGVKGDDDEASRRRRLDVMREPASAPSARWRWCSRRSWWPPSPRTPCRATISAAHRHDHRAPRRDVVLHAAGSRRHGPTASVRSCRHRRPRRRALAVTVVVLLESGGLGQVDDDRALG